MITGFIYLSGIFQIVNQRLACPHLVVDTTSCFCRPLPGRYLTLAAFGLFIETRAPIRQTQPRKSMLMDRELLSEIIPMK